MKRTTVLMSLVLLISTASAALGGDKGEGKTARLFLFQKCDSSLIPAADDPSPKYDSTGCPLPGNGPWPIFPDNGRLGTDALQHAG